MLALSMNFHDEQMPNYENLLFKNLESLILGNCKLRGSIPQWLSSCHKLRLLDLSWNHLVGSVPSWFGKFESLFYSDLSINSLQGEIPKSLTELQSLISGNITIEEPDSSFQLHFAQQGWTNLNLQTDFKLSTNFRPELQQSPRPNLARFLEFETAPCFEPERE